METRLNEEQWRLVLDLAHAVAELPEHERLPFLESTDSSPDVCQQVLALVEEFEVRAERSHAVGDQIGRFKLTGHLGSGGMGEVFSAVDGELHRVVALKFLNRKATAYEGATERLIREARTASSLNHPNIVTVHEVLRSGSSIALVMEFVEGTTLRQLAANPLALPRILDIGRQAANALAAASAGGVIHRDIKPENIMVRPDGCVKVMDFGLARWATPGNHDRSLSSIAGVTAGTWRYMSPEQCRGETLNSATDIFSFGLVLYELCTGEHPFLKDSAFETMQAITSEQPQPPSAVSSGSILPSLESLILAMLAKNPAQRPSAQSVAQVLVESAAVLSERNESAEKPATGRRNTSYRWTALVIGLVVAILAGGTVVRFRRSVPEVPSTYLVTQLTTSDELSLDPALSPDSERMAYVSDRDKHNFDIYVNDLKGGEPVRLTDHPANDLHPSWSSDGSRLAFLRATAQAVDIIVIPSKGGPERKVTQVQLRDWFNWKSDPVMTAGYPGPVWAADNQSLIVADSQGASSGAPLWRVSLSNGQRVRLTQPGTAHDFYPAVSHDGSKIAFVRQTSATASDVFVLDVKQGLETRITNESLDVRGVTWGAHDQTLLFSSNRNGIYQMWAVSLNGQILSPVAVGGSGVSNPSSSPDGKVLLYRSANFVVSLWSAPAAIASTPLTRISAPNGVTTTPAYSPDGRSIAFGSNRSGSWEIWIAKADGSSPVQRTHLGRNANGRIISRAVGTPAWSPNGKYIALDARPNGHGAIMIMEAAQGEPHLLDENPYEERMPSWSADGRFVYFSSDRSGEARIWKRPFQGGPAIPVTDRKGFRAFESTDGKTLYFIPALTEAGIYRMPADGGPAELLPGTEAYYTRRQWAVSQSGIYFAGYDKDPLSILFYRFASGKIEPVRRLANQLFMGTPSLDFNPETGQLVFSTQDEETCNIRLARAAQ